MSEHDPIDHDKPAQPSRRRWFRYGLAGLVGAAIGAAGGRWGAHAGPFGRGWCGPGRGAGMARAFAGRRLDRILDQVEATDDQRTQIEAILDEAFESLAELRAPGPDDKRAIVETLSRPEIDRAALEALRAGHMTTAEQASRAMARALADAAEVLEPAQRARLPEILNRFGRHRS